MKTLNLTQMNGWIARLEAEKRRWEYFFATKGIEKLRLLCGVISADITSSVAANSGCFGVPLNTETGSKWALQKRTDHGNAAWVSWLRIFRLAKA